MTAKTIETPRKLKRLVSARRLTEISSLISTSADKKGARPTSLPVGPQLTKHAQLVNLLSRPAGASIEDMTQATGWQAHSVRGFLAGTVKAKMGLALSSSKVAGELRRYRIATRRGR